MVVDFEWLVEVRRFEFLFQATVRLVETTTNFILYMFLIKFIVHSFEEKGEGLFLNSSFVFYVCVCVCVCVVLTEQRADGRHGSTRDTIVGNCLFLPSFQR